MADMEVSDLARQLRERWGAFDSLLSDLEFVESASVCPDCLEPQVDNDEELLEIVRLADDVEQFFAMCDARGCAVKH